MPFPIRDTRLTRAARPRKDATTVDLSAFKDASTARRGGADRAILFVVEESSWQVLSGVGRALSSYPWPRRHLHRKEVLPAASTARGPKCCTHRNSVT